MATDKSGDACLTLPIGAPSEAVLLRAGACSGHRHALRELLIASVATVCPERWLIVQTDSDFFELVWEVAGALGFQSTVRALNAGGTVPNAATITETQLHRSDVEIKAEFIGGNPASYAASRAARKYPTYAFGATGGQAQRLSADTKPIELTDLSIDLKTEICFGPTIAALLEPRGPSGDGALLLKEGPNLWPAGAKEPFSPCSRAVQKGWDWLATAALQRKLSTADVEHIRRALGQKEGPVAIAVFGSALWQRQPPDVDIIAIFSDASPYRRIIGSKIDLTLRSAREITELNAAGDLFTAGVLGRHRAVYDPEGFLRTPEMQPRLPTKESLRRQATEAMQLAQLLLTKEASRTVDRVWNARARWVTRTLCMTYAAWHGEVLVDKSELVQWFGGPDAAFLMGKSVGRCARRTAREKLLAIFNRSSVTPILSIDRIPRNQLTFRGQQLRDVIQQAAELRAVW